MSVEEIIKYLDDYLITTGKQFIGLRAANNLLKGKGKLDINLKNILEENKIPHAYKTETKPRQWRIPYSDKSTFKEKRKEFLDKQKTTFPIDSDRNKNSFRITFFLISCVVVYALFFKNNTSTPKSNIYKNYITTQTFATFNKSDFDKMYEYAIHNDIRALEQMLNNGRITILNEGTTVYLIDVGFGYNVIRKRGSTNRLWVASERVSSY